MIEHGKYKDYVHGCRCAACKEANRLYIQKYRALKAKHNPPAPKSPHGTTTRYRKYACRCAECRQAQRDSLRVHRTGDEGPGYNLGKSPYDDEEEYDD